MDLLETILEQHSKSQTDKIVRYIGNDPKRFAELMKLFFKGEYKVTQRAAWPMSNCVREHPSLIKPYFKQILTLLDKKDVHEAVTRNIMRLLQDVEIPKRFHGNIMNACFNYVGDINAPAAVKAFALTVLYNLSKEYPDIRPELQLIIGEQWDHETPAFRSRGKKILKALKK